MTPLHVVISDEAARDLEDIETWIADHDGEMRAAAAMRRLRKTMGNLAFMPGMGRLSKHFEPGQRAFPVAPWIIYYIPRSDGDGIDVLRVIDERRDLPSIFKKKKPRRR